MGAACSSCLLGCPQAAIAGAVGERGTPLQPVPGTPDERQHQQWMHVQVPRHFRRRALLIPATQ